MGTSATSRHAWLRQDPGHGGGWQVGRARSRGRLPRGCLGWAPKGRWCWSAGLASAVSRMGFSLG